ncbi:hypothetical protein CS022_05900 [Veronia nyctiphanis]|uniref:Lipoprotein n=1 Tax=Veronia nyctiphanis TaxID=1278244 RepID=A0A4Q0YY58_9GAMM|nr:hypothetical protein [Veronia nyctiphanis]RXJ74149.1 hypothetical protein CS022_05900 [Veronia nyctiphanis]
MKKVSGAVSVVTLLTACGGGDDGNTSASGFSGKSCNGFKIERQYTDDSKSSKVWKLEQKEFPSITISINRMSGTKYSSVSDIAYKCQHSLDVLAANKVDVWEGETNGSISTGEEITYKSSFMLDHSMPDIPSYNEWEILKPNRKLAEIRGAEVKVDILNSDDWRVPNASSTAIDLVCEQPFVEEFEITEDEFEVAEIDLYDLDPKFCGLAYSRMKDGKLTHFKKCLDVSPIITEKAASCSFTDAKFNIPDNKGGNFPILASGKLTKPVDNIFSLTINSVKY